MTCMTNNTLRCCLSTLNHEPGQPLPDEEMQFTDAFPGCHEHGWYMRVRCLSRLAVCALQCRKKRKSQTPI